MKKAADILRTILDDQKARQAGEWSAFFTGWQALAGEDIAAHSSVKDVKQGTVIVEVDHPGWLQMLHMRKSKILTGIKKRYPELGIRDIRIYVGSSTGGRAPAVAAAERNIGGEGDTPEEKGRTEDTEETQEYLEFKKMLRRLRS